MRKHIMIAIILLLAACGGDAARDSGVDAVDDSVGADTVGADTVGADLSVDLLPDFPDPTDSLADDFIDEAPDAPGKQAFVLFMQERYGEDVSAFNAVYGLELATWDELLEITSLSFDLDNPAHGEDRDAFVGHVADQYYGAAAAALHATAPDHLNLCDRIAAVAPLPVFRMAGKHCDVVSLNDYYVQGDPMVDFMLGAPPLERWADQSAAAFEGAGGVTPIIVTEYGIRGAATDATVLQPPVTLVCAVDEPGEVALSWEALPLEEAWRVYVLTHPAGTDARILSSQDVDTPSAVVDLSDLGEGLFWVAVEPVHSLYLHLGARVAGPFEGVPAGGGLQGDVLACETLTVVALGEGELPLAEWPLADQAVDPMAPAQVLLAPPEPMEIHGLRFSIDLFQPDLPMEQVLRITLDGISVL